MSPAVLSKPAYVTKADRAAWQENRKNYIGASEVAAVCGLSSFETPHSVYLKKKGLAETEDTLPMRRGRWMESFVVQLYCEHFGIPVKEARPARTFFSKDWPFIAATPDRLITVEGAPAVLEAKDVGEFQAHKFGPSGTDEVADEYLVQMAVQMAVTGRRIGRLAAFIKGREFRWYHFDASSPNMELVTERAVEEAVAFWLNHVAKGVPPPLTGHGPDIEYARSSEPDGSVIVADREWEAMARALLTADDAKKEAELGYKRLENDFIRAMGGACRVETTLGPFSFKPDVNQVKRFTKPKGRNSA